MPYSDDFRLLLRRTTEGMSSREVARLTGISHTSIAEMRESGKVPRPDTLAKLCRGLALGPEVRAFLFKSAGLADPDQPQVFVSRQRDPGQTTSRDELVAFFATAASQLSRDDLKLLKALVSTYVAECRREDDEDFGDGQTREGGA